MPFPSSSLLFHFRTFLPPTSPTISESTLAQGFPVFSDVRQVTDRAPTAPTRCLKRVLVLRSKKFFEKFSPATRTTLRSSPSAGFWDVISFTRGLAFYV